MKVRLLIGSFKLSRFSLFVLLNFFQQFFYIVTFLVLMLTTFGVQGYPHAHDDGVEQVPLELQPGKNGL